MLAGPRCCDRRPEFLQHPVVQALLAGDSTTDCPRQAVRNRVSIAAAEAMAVGWEGPPFNVELLASLRGMDVRVVDWLADDQDGCFIPGHPPVICLNHATPQVRARYTLAHEIVHTLLPRCESAGGQRRWKYRFDGQSPVEQLCQVGASEVLMPTSLLQERRAGRRESMALADELRRDFGVSLEAAVRNLVDLSTTRCAMVVLHLMNKPSELSARAQVALPGFEEPPPPMRLRIQYSWTSRPWDDKFLPQFKSVPEDSIAYAAVDSRGNSREWLSAEEDWSDVAGLGTCRIEAVSNRSERQSVLCLLMPLADTRDPWSAQAHVDDQLWR
jgi:Zn-dependent peptidase ImmA (M78 family)